MARRRHRSGKELRSPAEANPRVSRTRVESRLRCGPRDCERKRRATPSLCFIALSPAPDPRGRRTARMPQGRGAGPCGDRSPAATSRGTAMTSEPPSLNRRLQDACGAGNLADIATLIANGASVDGENAHGGRPLISAMFCGANQLQAIELLISHGAELDFTSFREAHSAAAGCLLRRPPAHGGVKPAQARGGGGCLHAGRRARQRSTPPVSRISSRRSSSLIAAPCGCQPGHQGAWAYRHVLRWGAAPRREPAALRRRLRQGGDDRCVARRRRPQAAAGCLRRVSRSRMRAAIGVRADIIALLRP